MLHHDFLLHQEDVFAQAFNAGKIEGARELYASGVVYRSPTVRVFNWENPIVGIDKALEFIQLTLSPCQNINYQAVEFAPILNEEAAFVRIHFDWEMGPSRIRTDYLVRYAYRDGKIIEQQLYYDPSAKLQELG